MKRSKLTHIFWFWPLLYSHHFLLIHMAFTLNPRKITWSILKIHFFPLAYNCSFLRVFGTLLKWCICPYLGKLYMRMSSKETTIKLPKYSLSTWCMNLMKVLGVLVKPKAMTNNSYSPNLVLKEIFHSFSSLILIWLYPLFKSNLENMVAPCS